MPENSRNPPAKIASGIRDFLDSDSQVIVVECACDTTMHNTVEHVVSVVRDEIGDRCTVAAPASRIARNYPVGSNCRSLFGLVYAETGILNREENLIHHARLSSNENCDHVYVVGDCHLVSDAFFQRDRRRFGSGRLLRDFMGFVGIESPRRKVVFVGDSWQMPRGRLAESALSDSKLREFVARTRRVRLDRGGPTDETTAGMSNRCFLAGRLDMSKFNLIDLKYDTMDCQQFSKSGLPLSALYSKLLAEKPGSWTVIAYSHKDVNRIIRQFREMRRGLGDMIGRGDIVEAHNTFTVEKVVGDHVFEQRICSGTFGRVLEVTGEGKIVQPLRGRPKPVEVEFLRLRVDWYVGECVPAVDLLCYKEFLYAPKPELSDDSALATIVYARLRYRDGDASEDTQVSSDSAAFNDPYMNAAKLRFGYAMTLHRAQGLRFTSKVVNLSTGGRLGKAENYFRWLYTAFSVPCNNGCFFNEPHVHPFAKTKWQFDRSQLGPVRSSCLIGHDPQNSEPVNTLGFEIEKSELRSLFRHMRDSVAELEVDIVDVEHHQYQEVYTFKSGEGDESRLRLYYNGQFRVTRIVPVESSHAALVGRIQAARVPTVTFASDLQEELYNDLSRVLEQGGLKIFDVEHHYFQEVYCVKGEVKLRTGEAKLSCYYDSSGAVTTGSLLRHSSNEIRQQLKAALTE